MKSVVSTKTALSALAGALLMFGTTTCAFADVVSGKIEFKKKAPFTGLLYVPGSGNANKQPVIDQKDKAFTTKIAVGSPNNTMLFSNSDTFDHNIYANDKKQKVKFDVGLMTPGNSTEIKMDWPDESLVRVGCKIHPKMRSYVANVKSDHFYAFPFKKKVKSYDFSIKEVPSDKDQLILMIPKYDKLTIELKKGDSKTIEVTRKGKVKANLTITRA
ncbi:MAG: hypothetical protein ACI8WB_005563 [Phenylobacterium sp.]|jgi:hypothetical protein